MYPDSSGIDKGVILVGDAIRQMSNTNLEDCMSACNDDCRCNYASFHEDNALSNWCKLFATEGDRVGKFWSVTYHKDREGSRLF